MNFGGTNYYWCAPPLSLSNKLCGMLSRVSFGGTPRKSSSVVDVQLQSIIASLTEERAADRQRIEDLEAALDEHVKHEAALTAELEGLKVSYSARSSSLDEKEKECRALQRQLDATRGELSNMARTGGSLISEVQALLHSHAATVPPPLRVLPSSDLPSEGGGDEIALTQLVRERERANFVATLSSYMEATRQISDVVAESQALVGPVQEFRTAVRSAQELDAAQSTDAEQDAPIALPLTETEAEAQQRRAEEQARKEWQEAQQRRLREYNRSIGESMRVRKQQQEEQRQQLGQKGAARGPET
jgi:hypothetical protein